MDKKKFLKWFLYFASLILFFILQSTPHLFEVQKTRPLLVLPLIICISCFEHRLATIFLAIFAGFLCDFSSYNFLGFYALSITAFSAISLILTRFLLKTNLLTSIFLVMIFTILIWFFNYLYLNTLHNELQLLVFFKSWINIFVYTSFISPAFYYLAKKLYKI